jgi:bifunctional UDP-N-acetylglucosamine pyrophosphorylase/glucosamine-1-phosphate N-acetyltransferase
MRIDAVILAAGKGTRMHSNLPKVLHEIGGKAMLAHVIHAVASLEHVRIHAVIGYGAEQIQQYFAVTAKSMKLNWVMQEKQLGTGHDARIRPGGRRRARQVAGTQSDS